MQALEDFVFKYRAIILAVLFALTIGMGFQAAKLRLDAGFAKTLPIGHEYIETFLQYQDRYAGANRVLVVLENKKGDIFTPEFLEILRQATNDVFFIPGVERGSVSSLWTPNTRFIEVTEDGLRAGNVVPSTYKPTPDGVKIVRENAIKAGMVGRLVATDFRSAMIQTNLQDIDPDTRQRLDYFKVASDLETKIREKYQTGDVTVKIIGFAKLVGDIKDGAESVVEFFAIAFVLTVGMLYLYCRSWSLTAVTVVSSLCSLVWQFGLLNVLGYGLDPLAVLVPFLVFAIGISHGVQQVNMAGAEIAAGKTREQAARDTFTFLFRPGTVALLTCLAGFGTLYIIPIGMIQELAITASIGISFKIISNLIMLPLLVSYMAPTRDYALKVQRAMASREKYWPTVATIAKPKPAFIMIGICIVIAIVGVIRSQNLQIGDVHAGAAELRPNSIYNQDSRFIVENFNLGLNLLTVVVETPEGACVDERVMRLLDRFQWEMSNVPGVQSAMGLPYVAKRVTSMWQEGNLKWAALPRDRTALSQSVGQVGPSTGLLDDKCTTMPLMIFTEDSKAETVKRVIAAVKAFRERPENQFVDPNDPKAKVTFRLASGNIGIVGATNEVVAASEIPMLLYVYAVVMLLVVLTYREWRGSVCCVLPLILSTIIGNWFLTEAEIGLKIATLPVLAIAVGIGVDYGIYEYNRIQRYMRMGKDPYEAYLQALRDVGSATMFTGFTLAVGVATWSFSALKFQADMGMLLTFMFMVNMIGAVTLLPALIAALEYLFPRKFVPLTDEEAARSKFAH